MRPLYRRLAICVFYCVLQSSAGISFGQTWNELNSRLRAANDAGKADSALFYASKAVEAAGREFGIQSANYALSLSNLGFLYYSIRNYDKAEPLYIEALAIRKSTPGIMHPSYATSLSNLAALYKSVKNYEKSEALYLELLEVRKTTPGTAHPSYVTSLISLAGLYQSSDNYEKAEALYKDALAIRKTTLGTAHPDYVGSLNDLAGFYYATSNYNKAEPLYTEVLEIRKSTTGTSHPDYASALNNLATIYESLGKYEAAEPLFTQALAIRKTTPGSTHPSYTASLSNLAGLYESMGNYTKAEPLYIEALALRKTIHGATHPSYITSLNNLGTLYYTTGKYSKAEALFTEALAIRKSTIGTEHSDYALSLNNLGALYSAMGNYNKAESLYSEALEIRKNALGTAHPDYASSVNNLAVLYKSTGKYDKAEPFFVETLKILKNAAGTGHPNYSSILNNLGALYESMGNHNKAEQLYTEALDVRRQTHGTMHPLYASSLDNLGILYHSKGNYSKAEPLYTEALEIRKNTLGTQHPLYATSLNNLASLYESMGRYARAETLYTEAIAIDKITVGVLHPEYAVALNNLAYLYSMQGNYAKSEPLYTEALNIRKAVLGTVHQDYGTSLTTLGLLYHSMGNYAAAESRYREAHAILLHNIENRFGFLSEDEKEKYLKSELSAIEGYHSFIRDYQKQKPSSASDSYDIELATKGMILSSGIRMRGAIQNSGNPEAVAKYGQWNTLKSTLARLYSLPVKERNLDTDSLESVANQYEKDLTRLSSAFRQGKMLTQASWKDVQAKLGANEVAIEFASFGYHNGKRWTDTTMYTALVLRKGDAYPALVDLCRQDQIDSLLSQSSNTGSGFISGLYRGVTLLSGSSRNANGRRLYQLVWKPLEAVLKPGEHVYFSPSGLLHQVSFSAIPAEDGTLLSDRYRLTQLSSTAMLLDQPPVTEKKDLTIAAFGGIRYDARAAEMNALLRLNKSRETVSRSLLPDSTRGSTWTYLPGTLKEINSIAGLAKNYNISVKLDSGTLALEEIYKGYGTTKSPKVIHIATHGFFFPDPKRQAKNGTGNDRQEFRFSDNPLNRSGLLFAGANRVWKGEPAAEGLEDGILTAYEASHVNLSNTELVALSACETGLGDIRGSEGVFGLQRAFKAAGARYLLMSLWKVPDAETAEFMTEFYGMLFSGQTIEESFNLSQTAMKKKYRDDPYKWAAFVLVR